MNKDESDLMHVKLPACNGYSHSIFLKREKGLLNVLFYPFRYLKEGSLLIAAGLNQHGDMLTSSSN